MTLPLKQQYDERGGATPAFKSQTVLESRASRAASAPVVLVRLQKLANGCWSVQAAAGGRGGLFRDYAAAAKFIRLEFAVRHHTVVETLSA